MNYKEIILLGLVTVCILSFSIAFLKLIVNQIENFKRKREIYNKFKKKHKKKEKIKKEKTPEEKYKDKVQLLFMLCGAVIFGIISIETAMFLQLIVIGSGLGFLSSKLYLHTHKITSRINKLKDIATLYESIDLFTKAGFNIRQSLQLSKILVPNIAEDIDKCINEWTTGPVQALSNFGERISTDLPEADVLTGILIQAEEGGIKNIQGIMEQEANRIGDLRKAAAESRIALGPIFSTIYLFLPAASFLGVIISPLAYYAIQMITDLRVQ